MKSNSNDLIPDFDAAVTEILRLTAQVQERLNKLPEMIQQLKDKIAARSREWEAQALAQIMKPFGDILKSVQITIDKKDGWEDVPAPKLPADNCQPGKPCVDIAYMPTEQRWTERRYFTITFADGTSFKGESVNGVLTPETLSRLEGKTKTVTPKPAPPVVRPLPVVKPLPPPPVVLPIVAPLVKAVSGLVKAFAKALASPLTLARK